MLGQTYAAATSARHLARHSGIGTRRSLWPRGTPFFVAPSRDRPISTKLSRVFLMNRSQLASVVITLSAVCAAPTANAATAPRIELQNAAGMCQPFAPTQQVRYDSSGLRNAGTAQFYVACSLGANWQGVANGGGSRLSIYVYNASTVATSVACTARPGYFLGAGSYRVASPRSAVLNPGSSQSFAWQPTDFGTTYITTPNITCTAKPGISIQWTNFTFEEDVGS